MLKLPEQWRSILGFGGFYEASDRGRVRSIDRVVKYTNARGVSWMQLFNGRNLMATTDWEGYSLVTLSKNNRQITARIHQLVLENFVGKKPKNMQCRHLDGNPANNYLSNLMWGTRLEDRADMIRHGRSSKGERHGMARLTEKQVLYIRTSNKSGLAKRFGISRTHIHRIKKGLSWAHV